MKKIIKNTFIILLFFITVLTIKNSNIKAATYGHYTYEENNDGTITITKYDGTAANNIEIPSTINGKKVTIIGDYAFDCCSGLTGNLVIPDSVTSIGVVAFRGCSGFNGNLTIGKSVTSIGNIAFDGCYGFTGNLVIPDSVTSIGYCAFVNCEGLTNFYVGQNNVNYSSLNGILYSKDKSKIIQCLAGKTGNLVIPDGVTSIGARAFEDCSGLTGNLVIPDSVTSIGEDTFFGCSGFNGSLIIPDSVTSIGGSAFCRCSCLTGNLVIPDSVTSIESSAFRGCSGFTGNLVIPDSVTSIGEYAFDSCRSLTGDLIIPNSVKTIGQGAFQSCVSFTGNLVIPDSVTSIESSAFRGCSGFTGNLVIPDSVTSIGEYAFDSCSGFNGNLTIPNGVINIGDNAFGYCEGFTGSLVIPESVTNIGSLAFNGCSGLSEIIVNDNNQNYCSVDGILYNKEKNKVIQCPEKKKGYINILNSVTSIEQYAFGYCSNLTGKLILPDSITSIGGSAFLWCHGFTGNLVIPDSVTRIGNMAFDGCNNLDKIIFVDNAPDIYLYTFEQNLYKIYYRKGTTGFTSENNWPTGQLVEYEESLKNDEYVVNYLASGNDREKIELNDILNDLVTPEYEVADTSVATVEQNGKIGYINPLKNGSTDVTVKLKYSDNVVRTINTKITVDFKVTNIKISPEEYRIYALGQTPSFKPVIIPSYAANQNVVWTSSDNSIATVSSNGTIRGISNGTCYITATTTDGSNLNTSIKIIVDYKIPITKLTLSKTSHTFTDSTPLQLTSTIEPDNATNKELTWTSSNTKVATVDNNGKVRPVANGTCQITVKTNDGSNLNAKCNITVDVEGPLYKKGDINKDGKVTVMDVRYGLKALTKGTITDEEIQIGDVNGDNKFSVMDARKILRYIVGKIPSLD